MKNIFHNPVRLFITAAVIVLFISFQSVFGQTGVLISASPGIADPSAMLEINSSTRGLLLPRVTLASATSFINPPNVPPAGLFVYNTGGALPVGLYYWNGATNAWVQLTTGGFSGAGIANYHARWTTPTNLGTGVIYDDGTNVGIGTTSLYGARLHIDKAVSGGIGGTLFITNTAAAAVGNKTRLGFDLVGFDDLTSTASIDAGLSNANGTTDLIFNAYDGTGTLTNYERMRILGSNGNVGIGTTSPGQKLEVNGSISLPSSTGMKQIYTWSPSDANWRIGMHDLTANVGFSRVLATSHVEFMTFASGAGQGFAVGDNVTGLSSFEVTGSGSSYASYFRGTVRSAPLAGSGYRAVFADANGVLVTANNLTLTSTSQADAGGLPSGVYTFNFPGSTGPQQLYYQNNLSGGVGYVRVFSSPYNGTATVNFVGFSFPFTKFLVQTDGINGTLTRATAFFSPSRLFNTDGSTVTATGGDHAGYRVFIGSAGGMGIYNTSQLPCNWGNSSGAVGAGFNGSTCGSFPNGLLWGTGTGNATYTAIGMTWEIWIAN